MKKNILLVFTFLILVSFISCSDSRKNLYVLPKNAVKLLAGEDGKVWKIAWRYNDGIRMNMAGCFLTYRITYYPDMTIKDNGEEHENCGSTLLGTWEIVTYKNGKSYLKWNSDQLPEIMNTKDSRKYFKILQLDRDTLKLQFRHKQFSSESTFIDTFVPEHIEIKDRNFHR